MGTLIMGTWFMDTTVEVKPFTVSSPNHRSIAHLNPAKGRSKWLEKADYHEQVQDPPSVPVTARVETGAADGLATRGLSLGPA